MRASLFSTTHLERMVDSTKGLRTGGKMKKFIMLLVFLCALVAGIVQAGQSHNSHNSGDALTNKDILLMLKAGLTPDIVIAKIKSSTCDFDTSPDALKELK